MADMTAYIGKDYPIMGYAANQSLSGSAVPKDRLNDELTELLDIRADIVTAWEALVDAYHASVTSGYSSESPSAHPPSGTSVSIFCNKYEMFGAFQSIVVITDLDTLEETWYTWGPANKTVMSIDGPYPKPILMAADAGEAWILGKGDLTYLQGGMFTAKHKFGGDGIVVFESASYNSTYDETSFTCFYEGELNGTVRALEVVHETGQPGAGDLTNHINDLDFIDRHIYGLPSSEGTQGVVPRIESIETGNEVMGNNVTVFNDINDFYRGNNVLETDFTTWSSIGTSSFKYVNVTGGEWVYGNNISLLDTYKIAVNGNMESILPSGTELLLDMTVNGQTQHRYTKVAEALYHTPTMATYCEVMLQPDIMTTITLKSITASAQFEDASNNLLLEPDLFSIEVSGSPTIYTDILYMNQVTVRIGGISSSTLPATGSTISLGAVHDSGLINFFNVFTKTDGVDPFAGYTMIKVGEGLPITYQINTINTA